MSYLGEYEHTVDAKGRVAIPARWREQVEAGLTVARGEGAYLIVYDKTGWEKYMEHILTLPTDEQGRRLRRLIFSQASDQKLDVQGRITLTPKLRELAQIESNDVSLIGVGDHVEIWERTRYTDEISEIEANRDAIIARATRS